MPRNIAAPTEGQRQLAVVTRQGREFFVTGEREARARVFHDLMHDTVIAAFNQDVGDGLAQLQTLGNGEKVILALDRGVLDKVGIAQLPGMHEHRSGHRDRVIEGEHAHELGGRIAHTRQPVRKFGARLDLDFDSHALQHIVEQLDLLVGIAARSGHEQIADALHDPEAIIHAASGNRADQLVDNRKAFCACIIAV